MAAVVLDDYLPTLEETAPAPEGRPMVLPVDSVEEDPSQPRLEFDPEALAELAASIGSRGVLQPVSVRRHPDRGDRWILNFGARRLRASKLAGKSEIPAFIDEPADSFVQVIENEHREALRPMELALFVKRQLDSGKSRAEIARELGKSGAYVSYICALIDPPDWLMDLYREGRCRGVQELYDLRRSYEEHPDEVRSLINSGAFLARGEVRRMLERLPMRLTSQGMHVPSTSEDEKCVADKDVEPAGGASNGRSAPRGDRANVARLPANGLKLFVATADGPAEVLFEVLPEAEDEVYVVDPTSKSRRTMKLNELQNLRVTRR